jgi:hypothetical protein
MPEYKRVGDRVEVVSPLKDVANLNGNMVGKINNIQVVFDQHGGITATKEYKNVHVEITYFEKGRMGVESKEVLPSVKVTLQFHGRESFGEVVVDGGGGKATFTHEGKKCSVDCSMYQASYEKEFLGNNWLQFKDRSFNDKVYNDFAPVERELKWVLAYDKRIAPVFKAEVERRKHLTDLVETLKLEAQQIAKEYDIQKNPAVLQPIFQQAKDAGVVDRLIGGLRAWARDRREHTSEYREEGPYGPWISLEEIASGKRVESFEDMTRRHQAERLDMVAKVLQKFKEKPTKQQEKEAAEWLAFDNALKKVEEMMSKEQDWSKNIGKFALRVIEEIKPICEPRKFAETLKRMMEFKQDDGVVQQLSALYSPMYFRNFMRMMGADISEEELQELFGKGKDRVGEYVRGKADETKGRELLALSEAILKRC